MVGRYFGTQLDTLSILIHITLLLSISCWVFPKSSSSTLEISLGGQIPASECFILYNNAFDMYARCC